MKDTLYGEGFGMSSDTRGGDKKEGKDRDFKDKNFDKMPEMPSGMPKMPKGDKKEMPSGVPDDNKGKRPDGMVDEFAGGQIKPEN